ncbi:MAG: amidase [Desulfatiglans sp.]|jgi:amidase|nr:amidase [Desulfatiglans sp.]
MSHLEELAFLDATSQAEWVRLKKIKPIELVDAAIERIERLNPFLNAVITPMYDLARKAATGSIPDGPFAGVPFLIKDLLAEYAGVRFTGGSAFLRDYVSDHDTALVVRIKKAGLIVCGKTNTPEFGSLPTTEPLLFGPTRNPWDTNRTPGGSSGGSAAAVASGMVPMAHGNDGGGSIRIPSSCCGVFGLKPTRARNPHGPDLGDIFGGLAAEHALTRSVRDSAALLDATSGPDLGDPYWAPPPTRPFIEEVGADPGQLRIAFTARAREGIDVHRDCVKAVDDVAELCLDLGHHVEEVELNVDAEQMAKCFYAVWLGGCSWTAKFWERETGRTITPELVEPLTWALIEKGRQTNSGDYLLAVGDLQRLSRHVARLFTEWDVWLTPTLAEPPLPLGTFDSTPEDPMGGFFRSGKFMPFTSLCNVTGQPAMSVPLFWNKENLPIGTQFIGRFGDEATLFRLASQLETARPWAHRRPPVAA